MTSTAPARTYEVRTHGCQMNVHDSERLTGLLEDAGYVARRPSEQADVVVFNTCAVRENADNKLYGNLGHLAPVKAAAPGHADRRRRLPGAEGPRRRSPTKAPWVDVVFGTHNIGSLPVLLERARVQEEAQVEILESLEVFPSTLPTKRESAYAAWVSISVGCNNTCTFCIVPALRGKEKDRRPGEILAEIEALVAEGVTEVTLLGQNVNAYGVEFGDRQAFSKLLRACGEIEGLERVRFTSPHPAEFTDDVIEAMAETPNVMPSLHMPLQSGSDKVLRDMRRSYRQSKLPRHHRAGPRRDPRRRDHHRHHRRLPRRDRGGLPGRRSTSSSGAVLRRVHLPVLQAPRHPGRRARRPGARRRSCRSATSGSSRLVDDDRLGGEQARSSGRTVELMVAEGEGRKDAATHRLSGPGARQPAGALHRRLIADGHRSTCGPATWSRSSHVRRSAPPRRRRRRCVGSTYARR